MANKLEVSVGIKNAAFKAGLDEMRSGVASLKASTMSMFANIVGGGALIAGVRSMMQYAGALDDLSKRHKVSSTVLQQWKAVVEDNGASLETFAASLGKLEVAQAKAIKGDETLIKAFESLGIGIEELLSMSPDELMLRIGSSSMEASAMVQVLGESAIQLRDSLRAASEEGLSTFIAMTPAAVAIFGQLDDVTNKLKNSFVALAANSISWVFIQLQKEGAGLVALYAQIMAAAVGLGEVMSKAMKGDKTGAAVAFAKWQEEAKRIHQGLQDTQAAIDAGYTEKEGGGRNDSDMDEEARQAAAMQKREDRLKKIREAEADAAREALEGQAKINALIEERNRLLEEYRGNPESDEGIDALEKAQSLQRKIESEQKRQGEEKKRRADDIAKQRQADAKEEFDRMQRIAGARSDEFQAREDDIISTLKGEDKLKALETKKARMQSEADTLEKTDPEAAARKRTQIISVNAEIRSERQALKDEGKDKMKDQQGKVGDAQDKVENAKRAAASVPVDSLGAVGGGRGNFGSGETAVRVAQQQLQVQQRMLAALEAQASKPDKREADPWR